MELKYSKDFSIAWTEGNSEIYVIPLVIQSSTVTTQITEDKHLIITYPLIQRKKMK